MNVSQWLEDLELGGYTDAFVANGIDGDLLLELTNEDLKDLGVARLAERKRLLRAIDALKASLDETEGSEPADRRRAERRQVAVLFADLADFTVLSQSLDPEQLRDVVNRFYAVADAIIEGHGGTVDKHLGDGVMALFGAPVAHDDDCLRAVRTAFDLHAAMQTLSTDIGRKLELHAGIACGEVVAGPVGRGGNGEYTALGDCVNLAARLDSLASAGQTFLAADVERIVRSEVRTSALAPTAIAGIAEPVVAWQALGLSEASENRGTGHRGEAVESFVGRRAQLRQLTSILDAAAEDEIGHAVLISGEAGIGKTRLVDELSQLAGTRGFAVHRRVILDMGVGRSQAAIRSLVRGLLDLPVGDACDRQDMVDRALAEGILSDDQRVFAYDLLDVAQSTELRAVYDAMDNARRNAGKMQVVQHLVAHAARAAPVLLVIEDVHWADGLTLAYLAGVKASISDLPAILALTARTEANPVDPTWHASSRQTPLTTVELGPLRHEEAVSIAAASAADDTTQRLCVERAGGHPLFLVQLLMHASETAGDGVPGSVRSLVQARLDRLRPADRTMVMNASVLGLQFAPTQLAHLMQQPDVEVSGAVSRSFLTARDNGLAFVHALVRDAVYACVLRERRRELHRRAAAWYAERDPSLRAEHLERAEDEDASRAYLAAAIATKQAYRFERASQLAQRGLAIARNREDRFELALVLGDLLAASGEPQASIERYDEAVLSAQGDEQFCRACLGIVASERLLGEYARSEDLLRKAEAGALRLSDDALLARVHGLRGSFLFAHADVEGCRTSQIAALAAAERAGEPALRAQALSGLGDAHYAMGRMRQALDDFRRCVAICSEHGLGAIAVANEYMTGNCNRYLLNLDEAIAIVLEATAMAGRVGNPRAEMVGSLLIGEIRFDQGDFATAAEALSRGVEIARRMGNARYVVYIQHQLARSLFHAGQTDTAAALAAEAVEGTKSLVPAFITARVFGLAASIARDPSQGERLLVAGEAIVDGGCLPHNVYWYRRDAIDAALGWNRPDLARHHADALDRYTADHPLPWTDFFVRRGRVLAAALNSPQAVEPEDLACVIAAAEDNGLLAALPALRRVETLVADARGAG